MKVSGLGLEPFGDRTLRVQPLGPIFRWKVMSLCLESGNGTYNHPVFQPGWNISLNRFYGRLCEGLRYRHSDSKLTLTSTELAPVSHALFHQHWCRGFNLKRHDHEKLRKSSRRTGRSRRLDTMWREIRWEEGAGPRWMERVWESRGRVMTGRPFPRGLCQWIISTLASTHLNNMDHSTGTMLLQEY